MPWELGYFDALKNSRVAVLPIRQDAYKVYSGSEYVGLYYHVQVDKTQGGIDAIWVHNGEKYVNYKNWINGQEPCTH